MNDWSNVKAFVDYCDGKSRRASSSTLMPCLCGKMLRLGSTLPWMCSPGCITPVKSGVSENSVNPGTEQDGSGRQG